jgi:acyl carrier protein
MAVTDSLLTQVIELVVRSMGVPADVPLDAGTRLIEGGLELDSIQVLELSVAVEKRFSIELLPADLREFATLGSLAALVRCRRE